MNSHLLDSYFNNDEKKANKFADLFTLPHLHHHEIKKQISINNLRNSKV